ncbi:hypothetical protein ABLG96_01200 [Nakamurella sp. A5-74]|uniref:Bacterial CdiA-CT RNAse A domain-containing protein n=1 Tax=Nakamurella sp. A5-74 TaxID=3158264 RepID=A0AAU8DRL7_9ACTN
MIGTITAGPTLAGDPDAIRTAGRNWRTAAMACAAAAAQVSAVAVVDGFLGDEAGIWEQRLGPQTSELLSTLATARDIVGGALVAYADALEDCQQELRSLAVHRIEAANAIDRWSDTPTATPDLVDSARQTMHDLDARAAAIHARHAAGARACCVQIDRATAMSPSRVAGVQPGLNRVRDVGGGAGRFHQSSNAVIAGFALTHPAQTSAIGPFLTTDNPRDAESDSDSRESAPRPWIDPTLQAAYRDRFYNACLGTKTGTTRVGDTTDMLCGVQADAIVESRENILVGLRTYPLALTQEEVYGLDDALADGWDLFTTFMFSGCKTGGSIGACIFDIASAPIPFAKGAKAVKVVVEVVDDGADVVKAGEKAAGAGKAADDAADATRTHPKPDEPSGTDTRNLSENGAPRPPEAQPPMTAEAARAWNENLTDQLAPGGTPIGAQGSRPEIRELPGGVPAAQDMFSRLAARGRVVENSSERTRVELPGGGWIQYRTKMTKSGDVPVTIDVKIPGFTLVGRLKFQP